MFKREDWIFGLIALVMGIAVLLYSKTLDITTSADPAGPAAMPRIIAWMSVAIGIVHLAGACRIIRKNPKPKPKEEKGSAAPVVLICAACAVYCLLLEKAGYLVMTPLLIAAIMTSVGERKIPRILGTSIGTTAFLFCVFKYVLGVNMSLGIFNGLLG